MELRPPDEARRALVEAWRDRAVRLLILAHLAVLAVFAIPEYDTLLRLLPTLQRASGAQIPALVVHHYVNRYGSEEVLYFNYASLMVGGGADVEELRERWGAMGDAGLALPASTSGPQLPYRDFGLEYPPGALPFMLLPRLLASDSAVYASVYRVQMGLLVLGALAMVLWLQARRPPDASVVGLACEADRVRVERRPDKASVVGLACEANPVRMERRPDEASVVGLACEANRVRMTRSPLRRTLGLSLAGLLALGPLVVQRLDAALSFFLVASVVAVATGRGGLGGAALAMAAGLKLWPALLLPHYLRGRDRRAFLAGFGLSLAALFLPWAAVGPERLAGVLRFHGERPLQLESTWASLLEVRHLALGGALEVARSYGAESLFSPEAEALRPLAPLAVLGLTLLVLFRYRKAGPEDLPEALLAGTLAVMLGSPVLSPQYLVAFLPLAFLARDRAVPLLVLAACGLTQAVYPWMYRPLARLETLPVLLLALRNVVLAVTLGRLLWRRR